jgi:hypothetical protein
LEAGEGLVQDFDLLDLSEEVK